MLPLAAYFSRLAGKEEHEQAGEKKSGCYFFFLPLLFLTFLMLFFIPDLHPHVLHIFIPFLNLIHLVGLFAA
jgi:hypothetical protein